MVNSTRTADLGNAVSVTEIRKIDNGCIPLNDVTVSSVETKVSENETAVLD